MLTFHCSRCGQLLQLRDEFAGRPARCPSCSSITVAPSHVSASTAASRSGGTPQPQAPREPTELPTIAPLPEGVPPGNGNGRSVGAATPDGILAPPRGPGEIGRLGSYRVHRVLGTGAMGVVFEAVDEQLQRPVALKALLPALAASRSARERFLREARAAAAVDHDHVVTIYQVGEDHGIPYLAMQLLQGETLDAWLVREKTLPVAEVVRIGREVAEGLAAAHEHGVIHRDVKPSNIWLEDRRRVKLLDFGLARAVGAASDLTPSGALVGTPAYVAPEQAGGRSADARCDLFSLGCVLYRCCTGRPPFCGSDTLAILTALATETPPAVRDLNPAVSPALSDLVMRLLEKDPARRPPSALAVVEALTALQEQTLRPASVLTVEPTDDLPPDDTLVEPDLRRPALPPPVRPASGLRWAALAGGLAALLGLFGVCLVGVVWWALPLAPAGPATAPVAAKPPRPDRWTVVFRGDDPALWNTDTRRDDQFAIPLRQVTGLIRYVRLRRLDNGAALILPITPGQLGAAPEPPLVGGAWWNGTAKEEWNGRHLGIAHGPRYKFPSWNGIIDLLNDGLDVFSGSGFGHKCGVNDKQYYCWQGREIARTAFEIAVTADALTDDEQRSLVSPP